MKKTSLQIKNYFQKKDGATAVEFGLIGILFMVFIFGMIESGRVFWTINTLEYAVQNASRHVLVNRDATDAEIEQVAVDSLEGIYIDPANLTVTVTRPTISGIDFIQVTGDYSFSIMSPAGPILPEDMETIPLSATSRLPLQPEG